RLAEAEQMLRAIRNGEVDALVIQTAAGPQVYTLQGQDAEASRIRGEMLAQVGEAIVAVDNDTRVTYLNAAAERQYGVVASRVLGQTLSTIFRWRWARPDEEAAAATALNERGEWRGETVHITNDGREFDVESGVTALRDHAGQTIGLLSVIRDVTERKQHEHQLLVSEIRYRRLFECAHDGVVIIDADTRRIIDANPFMTRLLGYSHAE